MPPAISTPMPFAAETDLILNNRSGTSGEAVRDSITRNATSRTAAAPSRPSVRALPQPHSLPFTIA
ncbi:MAG TPA: hypothetical protein VL422_10715 [Miltoncostaea sp.]|nr:hypothetical protein [Miltoncostaea sp.]